MRLSAIAVLETAGLLIDLAAVAGEADIVDAVVRVRDGIHGVDVTARHADEAWERYLDKWDVIGPGRRRPWHPRVVASP